MTTVDSKLFLSKKMYLQNTALWQNISVKNRFVAKCICKYWFVTKVPVKTGLWQNVSVKYWFVTKVPIKTGLWQNVSVKYWSVAKKP